MRRALLMLLALSLTPLAPPTVLATPAAASETLGQDFVAGAWLFYRSRFMTSDGRIVDDSNGNVSHSEGQGFGMLLAVAAADKTSFARILAWTRSHLMIRDDALAAWRWDPAADPQVADSNNATDGDLLIAWALLRAYKKWGDLEYFQAARAMAQAIGAEAVEVRDGETLLLPGAEGFASGDREDGPIVNLSYWVFPAIDELAVFAPEFPANELVESGLSLLRQAQFGDARLPSDWISLAGDAPAPAEDRPATFGYDAIRVPLYLAWYGASGTLPLEPFAALWDSADAPSVIDLSTGKPVGSMADRGYRAIVELTRCATGHAMLSDPSQNVDLTTYYPSTLGLLSLLAMVERYPRCLEGS
jgi:endoglucanase